MKAFLIVVSFIFLSHDIQGADYYGGTVKGGILWVNYGIEKETANSLDVVTVVTTAGVFIEKFKRFNTRALSGIDK